MQTFTGREYLAIDIASNFGLDKKSWDERLAWFDLHESNLEEMLPEADTPALYFAGVQAYRKTQRGEATGYPISLDATSSGLQLLAVLTGDRSAAELCNVVDTGNREDAYTNVYLEMLKIIGEAAKISREDTKRAIMTAMYGSQAVPKEVFGEGALYQVFINTMQNMAPAAWELNEAFLAIWDSEALVNEWVLPDNFHVRCKVMSSTTETVNFLNEPFEIHRAVNAPTKEGRSLGANTVHSIDGMIVREMTRRCTYDPNWISLIKDILSDECESRFSTKEESQEAHRMVGILWDHYQNSGYLSARILDYLDSDTIQLTDQAVIKELIDSLPEKPFQVITVHDCFRCLPNYGNDLRTQYNRQLYEIARSNLLNSILSQLLNRTITIDKYDSTLFNDIMRSNYSLS
jgi:hypothetical protein